MEKRFTYDPDKCTFNGGRTNEQRAAGAEDGVQAAHQARGEYGQIISEDGIRDLLADLGHLCDREGLDFVKIISAAKKDWRSER